MNKIKIRKRNLEVPGKLDSEGAEIPDPVPHAVTIGVRPQPSMDERIRAMLKDQYFRNNPDAGLDSFDDDDFEVPKDDPMYDFERRYEEIDSLKAELEAAESEVAKAKEEYNAKRKAELKTKDVTPKERTDSKEESAADKR